MKRSLKNILILCLSAIVIAMLTFLVHYVTMIKSTVLKIVSIVALNLANGLVALIAMKLTGIRCELRFAKKRQYMVGIALGLLLSVVLAFIPALCGFSLVGVHRDFSWAGIAYDFLFYMLIIGPVEELIFRVYFQQAFIFLFEKHKWIGVIISSFLFGAWHLINGTYIQSAFAFGIGLYFGFAKYGIKDCTYLSVSLAHGLYDFLNTVVCVFIVR